MYEFIAGVAVMLAVLALVIRKYKIKLKDEESFRVSSVKLKDDDLIKYGKKLRSEYNYILHTIHHFVLNLADELNRHQSRKSAGYRTVIQKNQVVLVYRDTNCGFERPILIVEMKASDQPDEMYTQYYLAVANKLPIAGENDNFFDPVKHFPKKALETTQLHLVIRFLERDELLTSLLATIDGIYEEVPASGDASATSEAVQDQQVEEVAA